MKIRGKWSDESNSCALSNTDAGRYTVIVVTVTDVVQLIIMLVGLMRNRRETSGLLRHLYVQVSGTVYCLVLTMTIYEIGLGLGVACRCNDIRGSIPGRFLFLAVT